MPLAKNFLKNKEKEKKKPVVVSPSCSSPHLPSSCVDSDAFLCKTSVFLTEEKKDKKKKKNILLQVFFSPCVTK